MKKSLRGTIKDYGTPVIIGLLLACLCMWHFPFEDPERLSEFASKLFPLVFTYATTMMGLALACFTLFQSLDNDVTRKAKTMNLYVRYQHYLLMIIYILAILAILCLILIFSFDLLSSTWFRKALISLTFGLSVYTIVALMCWIRPLIKFIAKPKP